MRRISERYKKLGKNIGFLTIGNFASKILNFLLVPIYTSILTTSEYGIADILLTTVTLLIPLFSLEICEGVMRFALDGNNDNNQTYTIGVKYCIFGTAFFLLFSPLILLFDEYKKYYLYFVLLFISELFYTLGSQFAKGINQVKVFSAAGVINTLLICISNILSLVVLNLRIEGYLCAYAFGYTLSGLYIFIRLKLWKYLIRFSQLKKNYSHGLLKYTIPLIPNAVCWWINNSSDRYILAVLCSTSVLGIYSIAYKIPSLLTMVSTIFFGAWQISSVEDFGSNESRAFYNSVYEKFYVASFTTAIGLIAIVKPLASLLFSNNFYIAWKCTILLISAYLFNSLSSFIGSIYTSSKKTKMLFITSLLSAVINIILNLLLIPIWGEFGAAMATVISYLVIYLIRTFNTKKIIRLELKKSVSFIMNSSLIVVSVLTFFDINNAFLISIIICTCCLLVSGKVIAGD